MRRLSESFQHLASLAQARQDRFLVCGLGSLGQQCVIALKEFGVSVTGIDEVQPKNWEIPKLPEMLEDLIVGDCRQQDVLEKASVEQFRAVLIVTSDERVNIEAAFAIRLLNPQTRLIVRSAKENLNELLSENLGNFVAFEPTKLPVTAYALAALGSETAGFFNLEGQWLRAIARKIDTSDRWSNQRLLHQLNTRKRLVLGHTCDSAQPSKSFYDWEPDAILQPGDTIIYIETTQQTVRNSKKITGDSPGKKRHLLPRLQNLTLSNLKQQLTQWWQSSSQHQAQVVATIGAITVLILLLCGTVLFYWEYPDISLRNAFYATAVLLLGGYGDLFGDLKPTISLPWWLQLFSLGLTLAGTAVVGVLYALLTEKLLSYRFQLLKRRPPVPQQDHVVLIGLGRLGQRVAALLQEFKYPFVGISTSGLDPNVLPQMPLIVGNFADSLKKANIATAKSVLVATDDDMVNLEIGLMAHAANPTGSLVIRTYEQRLGNNLAKLLPYAQVLCAYSLVAEAFAGAAFGENILSLFRLNNQTILVTEYHIESDDTLNNLLLAEVAYGYGVVPVLHQKAGEAAKLMPEEDVQLNVGDRMVVLATIESLRRIERGGLSMLPRRFKVEVEKAATPDAVFEGARAIARISGCNLSTATELMNNLPATVRSPLYKHQAQRLVRELAKNQIQAKVINIDDQTSHKPSNTISLLS